MNNDLKSLSAETCRPTPCALYVHGLGSGAATRTIRQIRELFPDFEWIAVEVGEDAEEAVSKLNRYVATCQPDLLMGTSLGGFYVFYANAPTAIKIICNPAMNIYEIIRSKIGFGEHRYFVKREDGKKTFTLDESVCERFAAYRRTHRAILGRANYAFFGDSDELIGAEGTCQNMWAVFKAGYSLYVEKEGQHRLNEHTLQMIREEIFIRRGVWALNRPMRMEGDHWKVKDTYDIAQALSEIRCKSKR